MCVSQFIQPSQNAHFKEQSPAWFSRKEKRDTERPSHTGVVVQLASDPKKSETTTLNSLYIYVCYHLDPEPHNEWLELSANYRWEESGTKEARWFCPAGQLQGQESSRVSDLCSPNFLNLLYSRRFSQSMWDLGAEEVTPHPSKRMRRRWELDTRRSLFSAAASHSHSGGSDFASWLPPSGSVWLDVSGPSFPQMLYIPLWGATKY